MFKPPTGQRGQSCGASLKSPCAALKPAFLVLKAAKSAGPDLSVSVVKRQFLDAWGDGRDRLGDKIGNAITDMSNCHGAAPSGSSILGTWVAQAQKDQLIVVTTIKIETNDLKSTITCQAANGPVDPKNPINAKADKIDKGDKEYREK